MRIERFRLSATGIVAALFVTSCASAPLPLSQAEIPAPHYDCKRENSIPLDLDRFAVGPETYVGRCIHARGFKIAGFFYPDIAAFYSGWSMPEPYKAIRLFGKEDARSGFIGVRETVDLTALAYSCREWNRRFDEELKAESIRISERGSPVTLIPSGHPCPLFNDRDAILLVAEWHPVSGMPRRLAGAEAARKYGQLLEVPDDWEHAVRVKSMADRWFDAVRRQDVEKFMEANGSGEDEREEVTKLLTSERSALRFLFGRTADPTIKYFRTKPNLEEPNVANAVEVSAYGCVCKTADCTDLWPIVWNDTRSDPDWPYFCVEIVRNREGQVYMPGNYVYELVD